MFSYPQPKQICISLRLVLVMVSTYCWKISKIQVVVWVTVGNACYLHKPTSLSLCFDFTALIPFVGPPFPPLKYKLHECRRFACTTTTKDFFKYCVDQANQAFIQLICEPVYTYPNIYTQIQTPLHNWLWILVIPLGQDPVHQE